MFHVKLERGGVSIQFLRFSQHFKLKSLHLRVISGTNTNKLNLFSLGTKHKAPMGGVVVPPMYPAKILIYPFYWSVNTFPVELRPLPPCAVYIIQKGCASMDEKALFEQVKRIISQIEGLLCIETDFGSWSDEEEDD